MHIRSTDGVDLALHDLGGHGPTVVVCHATGFHGRAYLPFAHLLTDVCHVWAVDFRGHGASTAPDDEDFDWNGMGDDLLAALDVLGPVRAIGHSMGGAAILLAALRLPDLITQAYLYEPIVFPDDLQRAPGENIMAGPARRRREVFESRAEALWRYAGRPPLGDLRADALYAYVDHGFEDLPEGGVRLACRAEHEARTFEASGAMTCTKARAVTMPVVVGCGAAETASPAAFAPKVAEALPNGELKVYAHLGHWGPLQDPITIAADVRRIFGFTPLG